MILVEIREPVVEIDGRVHVILNGEIELALPHIVWVLHAIEDSFIRYVSSRPEGRKISWVGICERFVLREMRFEAGLGHSSCLGPYWRICMAV